jgi:hypothetical protein
MKTWPSQMTFPYAPSSVAGSTYFSCAWCDWVGDYGRIS